MKALMLLIPGMFNTAAIWHPVLARLQPEVDVRIADVSTQDSITAMARDAWRLVDDLAPESPLIVCGFSMGGYVAIELLAAHRAAVHGLVMIDSSAAVETPESLLVREKTISALQRNFERTVEGIIGFSLHPTSMGNGALVDGMRRMLHEVGAPTAIRQNRAIMARADHRAMLAQLDIPALIICGREDQVTPPESSRDLARLIPGARLEWIEQAGHQTLIEQPEALAQLLRPFVTTRHNSGLEAMQ